MVNTEARACSNTAVIDEVPELKVKKNIGYCIIKRLVDIVGSAAALIVASPIILAFAVAVFIDDPHGSPFFSQPRVGKNGRVFKFWKIRSMVCNAEELLEDLQDKNEMEGPAFKIEEDPRITRIGKFIRKTSIDELPQFWNVLKGDMSIVGPRPPLPREVAQYNDYQKQRLCIQPGITCIWQVQPGRNDLSFDEWVALDIEYINNRSLWLDLKVMFQTVGAMLGGEGR